MDVSVVICTHNPRPHYLDRVLDSLRAQSLPQDRWELLLIDNASNQFQEISPDLLRWHPNGRLIHEPKLGLAHARICGIQNARGDLLVFVDDDNLLDDRYLETALKIAADYPMLGAWGSGTIVPEFESPPPDHLKPWLNHLAIRTVDRAYWGNIRTQDSSLPIGAGLCSRVHVAKAYVEHFKNSRIVISGRKGQALFGCEDYELCFSACTMGLGMGNFPELQVTHLIPNERLQDDYIVRLVASTRASWVALSYNWDGILPRCPLWPHIALDFFLRLRKLRGIERRIEISSMRMRLGVWLSLYFKAPHTA